MTQLAEHSSLAGEPARGRVQEIAGGSATVLLAPGTTGFPPLFLVQNAVGDVDLYRPVAQLLTGSGPVLGLRADLDAPGGGRRSITELAALHAATVQETTPTGPVRLAGHSFGGLVAHETARQLASAGRKVEFLGMVDVLPPAPLLRPAELIAHEAADRLCLLVPGLSNVSLRAVLAARLRPRAASWEGRVFAQSMRVVNAHLPQWHDGPVTYFRAARRIPALHHVLRAWRRITPRLTVVDVPGAHHDMLGPGNVAELARVWSREMAGAGRSTTP